MEARRRRVVKRAAPKATAEKKRRVGPSHIIFAGVAMVAIAAAAALILVYTHRARETALAQFEGGKVTRDEFLKRIPLEAGKYDPLIWRKPDRSIALKKSILDEMIKEKILLNQAKRRGITATDREFASELNSYKSGYTDETFSKMLELKGISYKDWSENKKNKYLIQKMIEKEVINKIPVSDADIKKYYSEHIKDFDHPEQVRARQILVTSLEEAQKIASELNAGANFAQLAKDRSIGPERWKGGDLGYFSRGTHPRVFDLVCFNMAVGEISQPVKSEYGYHIFKVIDKRPEHKEKIDEARNYIIGELRRQRSKEAFENWFKPIYDAADVKINDELLSRIEISIDDTQTNNN